MILSIREILQDRKDLARHKKIKGRLKALNTGFVQLARKHERSRPYFRNISRGVYFTYAAALALCEETGFKPQDLWPDKDWNAYLAKRSANQ